MKIFTKIQIFNAEIKSFNKIATLMENHSSFTQRSGCNSSRKRKLKYRTLSSKPESLVPKKIFKMMDNEESKIDFDKIKSGILEKYNDVSFDVSPTKSESDKKEYLVMKLSNGLTALLISDVDNLINPEVDSSGISDTDSDGSDSIHSSSSGESDSDFEECDEKKEKLAACALTVGVGSFSDPEAIPGLAHFLEHMVFMGSKKFPKENDFDSYISTRGGSTNASTECEYTTFYFDCPDKHLQNSMDRFANFFVFPLMKRDTMSREREAVESEFKLSLTSDSVRTEQLFCSTAPLNNPAHKFMWGNLITLQKNVTDDDLYSSLREFWKKHYSANLMTVAVQARLPLDTLGIWVAQCFGEVPSHNAVSNKFPYIDPPFRMDLFNKIFTVKPIKDINRLHITWAFPSVIHLYKSKPLSYLSFLIGHEGEGSLLSYLQEKLWALGITAGCGNDGIENNTMYSLFSIDIDLTDEGLKNIKPIIRLVFCYLELLKRDGISEAIFKESQIIDELHFRFQHEKESSDYVEELSINMQFYPPIDYITGDQLLFVYEPNEITKFLEIMIPSNVNIMLLSKSAANEVTLDQTEPWFNTNYKVEDISEEFLHECQSCEIDPKLFLPKPNIYIPSDFDIIPAPSNPPEYPINIVKNEYLEVWYKQDVKFKLPYGYIKIYLISPLASSSPQDSVMCNIFVSLFDLLIVKETYSASLAGLCYSLSSGDSGLILSINGFNHKILLLLKKVLTEMKLFAMKETIPEGLFKAVKEQKRREYHNGALKPSKLANELRLSILCPQAWGCVSKLETIDSITVEKFQNFNKNFFENLYIKCLIQGNISEKQAYDISHEIKEIIDYKPLLTGTYPRLRTHVLPVGENIIRVQSFNTQDTNCNVTNYYQCGLTNTEDCCLVEILMLIMEEPLFDTLRTQEQLAYDVSCGIRDTLGVLGFTVTVKSQADKFNVEYVENRITLFLSKLKTDLEKMSVEDFNQIKESLKILKLQDDTHLKEDIRRNWSEIVSDEYIFDRIKREVKSIETIQLEDVNQYFKKILGGITDENDFTKTCLRKLSIQVDADGHPIVETEASKEANNVPQNSFKNSLLVKTSNDEKLQYKFIKNIEEFKSSMFTFPCVKNNLKH